MPNLNFESVVMDRGNQAAFVAADIEDREPAHLVGMGENAADFRDFGKVVFPHFLKSVSQSSAAIRMAVGKVV